ncbi:marginal zone B- and B1-cell-specific protein [Suncus etruscus]|uniref:marginal zone B- and B1-cell-specific protein n=1 Tax=Suncus etruscus TaxID=109475 RepID=UPI0021105C24|nr:marginal zone B- and B1-cell-specific protein [Suncus etruscus]
MSYWGGPSTAQTYMHPHHSPHSLSQLLWTMKLSLALLLLLLRVGASSGDFGDRLPLTASSPQLDEEEKFSAHMPPHLRCDACRAVAYQMWQHLANAEAKLKTPDARGRLELRESEYTDVLDQSCSQSWQDYGVREVNQVKRLTGPGLNQGPEQRISVIVSGGLWPIRLSRTCLHFVGEFGEDQIYNAYQQGQGTLETLLCGGPKGVCSKGLQATREDL